jgi:lysophospholipase L1-like esterase
VDVAVTNAGVGGETADQTLDRLRRLVGGRGFDLVIWQVGTNDAVKGASEDAFLTRLRQGIAAVKGAGADLVLMDQQYLDQLADPARYRRFVDAVAAEARAGAVPLFSRYAAMRLWASTAREGLGGLLAQDRFHLNDRGYACLARDLAAAIAAPLARGPAVAARAL